MNRPINVLIVEDLPLTAVQVKTALETEPGVAAEYALSLDEATARLDRKNGVDVVLLDLGLPDADGIKAVETLMARHSDTPIVVLSGRAEEYAAALEAGAHEFLTKPQADPRVIVRALRNAVIRHRVRPIFQPVRAQLREAGRLAREAKQVIETVMPAITPATPGQPAGDEDATP